MARKMHPEGQWLGQWYVVEERSCVRARGKGMCGRREVLGLLSLLFVCLLHNGDDG